MFTTHVIAEAHTCPAERVAAVFGPTAELVGAKIGTGTSFADAVVTHAREHLPTSPLKVVKNYHTDFVAAVGETRELMLQCRLTSSILIFNTLAFNIESGTPDTALQEQFRSRMEDGPGARRLFHVSFGFIDNRPENVACMANIVAYAKLIGERVLVVGPTMEKWISPSSTLEHGISGCGEYNGLEGAKRKGSRSVPESKTPAQILPGGIAIKNVVPDMLGIGFQLELETKLPQDAVFEFFRKKLFPVEMAQITPIEAGFQVQIGDFSSPVVRMYFDLLRLLGASDSKSGQLQPAKFALPDPENEFERLRETEFKRITIAHYYDKIDARDGEWVVDLFIADDPESGKVAVYERAEDPICGQAALRKFYIGDPALGILPERQIHGRHSIEQIEICGDDMVIVRGRFDGHGAAGNEIHVTFSDFWTFDNVDKSRIAKRITHLGTGASVVRS